MCCWHPSTFIPMTEIRVLCYLLGSDASAAVYDIRGLHGETFTFRKDRVSGRHVLVTSTIRSLGREPGSSDPTLSVDEFNSIREKLLGGKSTSIRPMIELIKIETEDPEEEAPAEEGANPDSAPKTRKPRKKKE